MKSTGRMSQKGSQDAADYAQKRREQMERAKQLREERKNGVGSSSSSNVFKSAGQDFVHRQSSTNSRSAQHTVMSQGANGGPADHTTNATSMLSSPSIHGGGRQNPDPFAGQGVPGQQRQSQYSQMGYQQSPNYNAGGQGGPPNGYLQTQQIFPGDNFMPPQMDAFSTPLNGNGAGGMPQPHYPPPQNFGTPNMGSDGFMRNSNQNFAHPGEGVIINSRTQDNYYQNQQPGMNRNRSLQNGYSGSQHILSPGSNHSNLPPRQQSNNFGGPPQYPHPSHSPTPSTGLQTIQHDGGYRQQTQNGFHQQNLVTQQDFGAFRSQGATAYPGHLTPNRQTHYSQRDVDEARGSLTLLKKRMSNSRDRQNKNATIDYSSSQNLGATRGQTTYDEPNMMTSQTNARSQRQSSFQNSQSINGQAGAPPRPPRVNQSQQIYNSNDDASLASTPGGQINNYRKAFKPNIPPPRQNAAVEDVDQANALALGMPHPSYEREGLQSYNRDQKQQQPGRSENQVLQSSPAKKTRAGLPPSNRSGAAVRQSSNRLPPRQQQQQLQPQEYQDDPYDAQPSKPSAYNFDENMDDPFGGKAPSGGGGGGRGVQNTPPQASGKAPTPGNYGGGAAQTNFHDELAPMNENATEQPEMGAQLVQCSTCDRKFNQKALERHSKICVKVFQTKRKAFDVTEARKATDASGKGLEGGAGGGGGMSNYKPKLPGRGRGGPPRAQASESTNKPAGKIPKWKIQSMQFRQAVGPVDSKPSGGGGASNFNPSMDASPDMDDRVQCQFCGRKFAEKTAERHIPHCETKYKAQQMKNGPPPRGNRAASKGPRR